MCDIHSCSLGNFGLLSQVNIIEGEKKMLASMGYTLKIRARMKLDMDTLQITSPSVESECACLACCY